MRSAVAQPDRGPRSARRGRGRESISTRLRRAVRTLAGMVPAAGLAAAGRPLLEALAMQLLRDRPQLASLFVGDPQGNFLMVQRSPAGALDTKLIAHERRPARGHLAPPRRRRSGRARRARPGRRRLRSPHPPLVSRVRARPTACSGPTSMCSSPPAAGPDRSARDPRRGWRGARRGRRRHHARRAQRAS